MRRNSLWGIFRTGTVFPRKLCPKCAEDIYADALVCPYCGHDFNDETPHRLGPR
jgi:predicted amidophosphoribosyltransferase